MNLHRALLIPFLTIATLVAAKPGDLDLSYGDAGIARFKHLPSDDSRSGTAILPSGKIVSAGFAGGKLALLRRTVC